MPGEQTGPLPDELSNWLDRYADESGRSRTDVLAHAVMAYRLAEETDADRLVDRLVEETESDRFAGEADGTPPTPEAVGDLESQLSELDTDVDALAGELDELEATLDERVTDVRERVVQVLREAESRAPADHSHPALESGVTELERAIEVHEDRLDDLEARIDDELNHLRSRTDEFADAIAEAEEKLTTLANATVGLQRRVGDVEGTETRRRAVEEIRTAANRHGVAAADCEHCGKSVRIALLTAPRCPHCERYIESVVPSRGFFGSARLTVGDRPALEGDADEASDRIDFADDG